MKQLVVLAGPNGAGKSTLAPELIWEALHVSEFVNADVIARGLSAFGPQGVAIDAGRIMLRRLRELAAAGSSFAFETTLAARTYAPFVKGLRASGYYVHLRYVWVRSPELSIQRVGERVRRGGHSIPEETIRRRYAAGVRNFFALYRPLADLWHVYDNSETDHVTLLAWGHTDASISVLE